MVKDKKYILDGKRILTYDVGFKSVFGRSTELMARFVSIITGIEYDILKDNIILIVNEIPIIRRNEEFKKCDFIVRNRVRHHLLVSKTVEVNVSFV